MTSSASKLILVMGATGAGKTTFVNLISHSNLEVGHGLASCTADMQIVEMEFAGQQITLVDTPGFDDTERPQADVLKQIATFLQRTYEGGRKVDGLIFMHRISDNRMGGTAVSNYRLFSRVCGEGAMKNVVIVTNMWNEVLPEMGVARERELRETFFAKELSHGARMLPHDATERSARAIMQELIGNQAETLLVQTEMVHEKKSIPDTQAGTELDRELTAMEERHRSQIQQLVGELRSALTQKEQMEHELDGIRRKLIEVELEKVKLREALKEEVAAKLATVIRQAMKQPDAHSPTTWGHRLSQQVFDDNCNQPSSPPDSPPGSPAKGRRNRKRWWKRLVH
ncbi:nucleoside triphosphate hydrolase protein [Wolfiporia cocos MD-104 SS10]|uniref:Nucleoside triphosphate hydrolase protein n=1 Tax=Wolfiporia cocos (strain MD-104) TaxID=742152 RepID=A0A2H3JIV7_WOLCO|nr:nucleoside triphosphate hydrolase protein [Wolfiporia cocos MD-104 SS10]